MERTLPASPPVRGDLTQEAAAAMRALAGSEQRPFILAASPAFTTNPYQRLLYRECRAAGIAPVRVVRDEQLDEVLELQRAGLPTLLHLHWLHLVLKGAETRKDARRRADAFLARLDRQRAAGSPLAWTVHNILPHEARFEAEEARLCQEVANRCDVVHILAERTPELVAPQFTLPEDRLLVVPHMSYDGAYEDHVSGLDARHELGLMPDELVFLALGAIRPYKGLPELLDAWASLAPDEPRRLVIAGAPTDEPGVAELLERAALLPGVLLDARKIPAPEMQVFLRAADVAVLPYHRPLNSGALMLALTFGLPAIVPAGSGLADAVDERFGRTFEAAGSPSLADVLGSAAELATQAAREAARAAAADLSPATVSRQFATGLRARLAAAGWPG
jgi:glycosyltransferase involved in cell wall biosynthesis